MAQNETPITVVGNMVTEPELRFTPSGAAVCNFRIASTPRQFNKSTSQWEDMEGMFLTCNVWRQAAENVAESLQKGMRVIVQGRLRQRSYTTKEGEQRTTLEVEVDEVGPSLTFATAQVNRTQGGQRSQQPQQRAPQQRQGGFSGQQPNNDPWGSTPVGGDSGLDETPPF